MKIVHSVNMGLKIGPVQWDSVHIKERETSILSMLQVNFRNDVGGYCQLLYSKSQQLKMVHPVEMGWKIDCYYYSTSKVEVYTGILS